MATAAKKVEAQTSTGLFVIMASDKGGVGKSFFFRFLAEFLRKQKEGVLLFDGDGGTGSSFRIFGKRDNDDYLLDDQDPAVGIQPYNLRKSRPRETLINSATLGGTITMHDLPGGSFDAISEIVDGVVKACTAFSKGSFPSIRSRSFSTSSIMKMKAPSPLLVSWRLLKVSTSYTSPSSTIAMRSQRTISKCGMATRTTKGNVKAAKPVNVSSRPEVSRSLSPG